MDARRKSLRTSEAVFEAVAADRITSEDGAKLMHYDDLLRALTWERRMNWALWVVLGALLLWRL